jgi:hypothetical protein
MDLGLIVTFAGVIVATIAGVLGVWMERDRSAPPKWAWVFSGLIIVAMFIEMGHSSAAAAEGAAVDEKMANVLEQLATISAKSDNPALNSFVGSELAAQARNNPEVMEKVADKVAAKGGDPKALAAKAKAARRTAAGLPAKRPAGMARPGSKTKGGGKVAATGKGKGKGAKGKGGGGAKGKGKGAKGKGKGKGGGSGAKGKGKGKGKSSGGGGAKGKGKGGGSGAKGKGGGGGGGGKGKASSSKSGGGGKGKSSGGKGKGKGKGKSSGKKK